MSNIKYIYSTSIGDFNKFLEEFRSRGTLSGFGENRVIQTQNQFDVKSIFGLTALRDNAITTGASTIVNNFGDAEYTLTANAGREFRATAERGRYTAGSSLELGIGVRMGPINSQSTVIKYGYYDDDNGFYFVVKWNPSFFKT